jgi:hypothetical protein
MGFCVNVGFIVGAGRIAGVVPTDVPPSPGKLFDVEDGVGATIGAGTGGAAGAVVGVGM